MTLTPELADMVDQFIKDIEKYDKHPGRTGPWCIPRSMDMADFITRLHHYNLAKQIPPSDMAVLYVLYQCGRPYHSISDMLQYMIKDNMANNSQQ